MTAAAEQRLSWASWLSLAAVLAAAILVRFVGLDHLPGVNGDEAVFPVHAAEWRAGASLSELRTGTNLPMNPVFFGIVSLLDRLLPASFWTLRLAAVVASLLAVALGFWLLRFRGVEFAATFALLMAALPIQLGYARLAWDPTAVPAVLVLALAAALRGRVLWSALSFGLCLWVHPASVFAAPILLAVLLAARWPRLPDGALRLPGRRALAIAVLCVIGSSALSLLLIRRELVPPPVLAVLRGGLLAKIEQRALDPGGFLSFLRLYLDFLAGPTIYRYLSGSMPDRAAWLHAAAAAAALVALFWAVLRRASSRQGAVDAALILGLGASLVGAYLIGGLEVISPHTERYSMFLVAPTCYALAAGVHASARTPRGAALARLATAAAGALLLLSFHSHFFHAYRHADPERHNTFRTGAVEPKQRALELIVASRAPDRITLIRAEDWWLYWPLRYLAGAPGDLQVTIPGETRWSWRYPADFPPSPAPGEAEIFDVVWAGSRRDAECARTAQHSIDVGGYEPGPILRVHRQPLAEAP